MTELIALADVPENELGTSFRALRGEAFTASSAEAASLIQAGIAVAADSAEAELLRDVSELFTGKRNQ